MAKTLYVQVVDSYHARGNKFVTETRVLPVPTAVDSADKLLAQFSVRCSGVSTAVATVLRWLAEGRPESLPVVETNDTLEAAEAPSEAVSVEDDEPLTEGGSIDEPSTSEPTEVHFENPNADEHVDSPVVFDWDEDTPAPANNPEPFPETPAVPSWLSGM